MIRSRMQAATEHLLAKSQYGFRPHISTSHAIYILRRIQDYAEIKGTQLTLRFLIEKKLLVKFNIISCWWRWKDWDLARSI